MALNVGPWSQMQISIARRARWSAAFDQLGAYHKVDRDYEPLDSGRKSVRVHVNYRGRDFRFVITGEKFINELLPVGTPNRGGGGCIDLIRHVSGLGFVQSVNVCLKSLESAAAD